MATALQVKQQLMYQQSSGIDGSPSNGAAAASVMYGSLHSSPAVDGSWLPPHTPAQVASEIRILYTCTCIITSSMQNAGMRSQLRVLCVGVAASIKETGLEMQ